MKTPAKIKIKTKNIFILRLINVLVPCPLFHLRSILPGEDKQRLCSASIVAATAANSSNAAFSFRPVVFFGRCLPDAGEQQGNGAPAALQGSEEQQ